MDLDLLTDVIRIYLDFRFNSVSHARLLLKLEAYSIDGNLLGYTVFFLIESTASVL